MPGGKGNYVAQAVLDAFLGKTAPTLATTVYAAAFTALPTDAGGGTEVSGTGYARVALTNNATNFPNSTTPGGLATKQNGTLINFGTAGGAWGTVVGIGFYDASTAGNLLYWGPLGVSVIVATSQQLQIAIGGVTVTEA